LQLNLAVLRTLLRALPFERPLVYGLQPKALCSFSGVNGMQSRRPDGPCRQSAVLLDGPSDALSVKACRLVPGCTRTEQLALVALAPAMMFLEN
jgi:hypothetical protein